MKDKSRLTKAQRKAQRKAQANYHLTTVTFWLIVAFAWLAIIASILN
jgi:hypothetical protein